MSDNGAKTAAMTQFGGHISLNWSTVKRNVDPNLHHKEGLSHTLDVIPEVSRIFAVTFRLTDSNLFDLCLELNTRE